MKIIKDIFEYDFSKIETITNNMKKSVIVNYVVEDWHAYQDPDVKGGVGFIVDLGLSPNATLLRELNKDQRKYLDQFIVMYAPWGFYASVCTKGHGRIALEHQFTDT